MFKLLYKVVVTPTITPRPGWAPDIELKWRDPLQLVRLALNIAILAVIVVSVFMIVWSGFKLAISSGKQDKIDEAKKAILYSFLGIGVAIAAYVAVAIIFKFLTGVDLAHAFNFF